MPVAVQLKVITNGRFLCVEITNVGALGTFSGSRTIVKSISLEGALAIDADTGNEFRVLDSPRHYHAKTF